MRKSVLLVWVCWSVIPLIGFAQKKKNDPTTIVNLAIKAHGGEKVLKKYHAAEQSVKGTMTLGNQQLQFQGSWWSQYPDKLKNELTLEIQGRKTTIINVLNGDKGWIAYDGNIQAMSKEMIQAGLEELHASSLSNLTRLKNKEYQFTSLGESTLQDIPVLGIRVSHQKHKDVELFFHKKKRVLSAIQIQVNDPYQAGKVVTQTFYFSDYQKEKNGVRYPSTLLIQRDGKSYLNCKVTKFVTKKKLDEKIFKKP